MANSLIRTTQFTRGSHCVNCRTDTQHCVNDCRGFCGVMDVCKQRSAVIPASVPLLGHTINIEIVPAEKWEFGEETAGLWHPSAHQIYIHGGLDESLRYHTFFHELLHACLDLMSHKLARNEPFVDQLAGLLHQALVGAKYPAARRRKAKT